MRNLKKIAMGLAMFAGIAASAPALADSGDSQTAVQAPSADVGRAGGLFANSTFELASGVDYSAGHYGALVDTTVWSVPIDLKAQIGRLRLQASLPYVFMNGPGQMVGGVIVSSANSTTTTSRSGIGDLNFTGVRLTSLHDGRGDFGGICYWRFGSCLVESPSIV